VFLTAVVTGITYMYFLTVHCSAVIGWLLVKVLSRQQRDWLLLS